MTTFLKEYARSNVMYSIYGDIVLEHLVDSYNSLQEINKFDISNDMSDYDCLYKRIEADYIEIIVFSAMCIEAFLNDYIASCTSDNKFHEQFDRLPVLTKFEQVIESIFKISDSNNISNLDDLKSKLRELNKSRNELVHSKSKSAYNLIDFFFDDTDIDQNEIIDYDNEYEATIEHILNECKDLYDKSIYFIKIVVDLANFIDSQDDRVNALCKMLSFCKEPIINNEYRNDVQKFAFKLLGLYN